MAKINYYLGLERKKRSSRAHKAYKSNGQNLQKLREIGLKFVQEILPEYEKTKSLGENTSNIGNDADSLTTEFSNKFEAIDEEIRSFKKIIDDQRSIARHAVDDMKVCIARREFDIASAHAMQAYQALQKIKNHNLFES